jgi:hypothetical protein
LLEFFGLLIKYPMQVHVDNIGAIYLSKTATGSNRTKHVDTRYHFVREYVDKGVLKIIYVQSRENDADVMTKNLPEKDFKRHVEKIMAGNK